MGQMQVSSQFTYLESIALIFLKYLYNKTRDLYTLEWYSYSSNVREKKAKHLFSRKLTQQETLMLSLKYRRRQRPIYFK